MSSLPVRSKTTSYLKVHINGKLGLGSNVKMRDGRENAKFTILSPCHETYPMAESLLTDG